MKFQLINNSKLKIYFNLKDLEENNISLHSFLSGSQISKNFFEALLEIAEEDFGIVFENKNFCYETFCINFSEFIIILSPQSPPSYIQPCCNNENKSLIEENITPTYSFKFIDNKLLNYTNYIYYTFTNIEAFLKSFNIESVLYKYKNIFLLEIKTDYLSIAELEKLISILSETKSILNFSNLLITHIKEFSEIFISTNALNI